jgi:hypothetical protein
VDEYQPTRFDDGVLTLAADFYRHSGVPIVIPGYVGSERGQGETGYPGPIMWRDELEILGVPEIHVFPTEGKGINTRTETDDFLDLAVDSGWARVVAVTQQSHALRAMLGTVKALQERGLLQTMQVVPAWPLPIDWTRPCYGSQGTGPYPRLKWIDEEFERIPRYQQKGDLATLAELSQYLERIHGQ